jgi:hypothetical protein
MMAVVVCGFALSACNSGFMQRMPSLPDLPSFDAGPFFSPQPVTVNVETIPPCAEVTSSAGGYCRTPCSLIVKAKGNFVVDLTLSGYQPQTVPVKVLSAEDPRFVSDGNARPARTDPEKIFVEFRPVEPTRRMRSPPRR